MFFLIGELVPEENPNRQCMELHLQILFKALASDISPETLPDLGNLIQQHHQMFVQIYQIAISPKMHYNVHIPTETLRLISLFCFCFCFCFCFFFLPFLTKRTKGRRKTKKKKTNQKTKKTLNLQEMVRKDGWEQCGLKENIAILRDWRG